MAANSSEGEFEYIEMLRPIVMLRSSSIDVFGFMRAAKTMASQLLYVSRDSEVFRSSLNILRYGIDRWFEMLAFFGEESGSPPSGFIQVCNEATVASDFAQIVSLHDRRSHHL